MTFLFVAFNRVRVAAEGTIPIIIEYMLEKENDIVGRQYCAMCLGNLAAEPENHQEIVKTQGTVGAIFVCVVLLMWCNIL